MRRVLVVLTLLLVTTAVVAPAKADPPQITAVCVGAQSCVGWFRSDIHLHWVIDGGEGLNCDDVWIRDDTPPDGVFKTCNAENPITHEPASASVKLQRDATPPIISGVVAGRPPDHAGWYRHPVTFTVQADDVTSKLAGCDAPSYGGPDSANAIVVATCRDKAGNSASRAFPLSYDATAPDTSGATVTTGDKVVRLRWPAGSRASLTRIPGVGGATSEELYEGSGTSFTDREVRNGKRYRYVLTLTDEAGNSASRELSGRPQRRLLAPAKRASLAGPPLLAWTAVRGARYYNVQIFRSGHKILSAWPRKASLQLKAKWRFRGKHRRLKPALYRWYVWPGLGARREHRYGNLIGRRSFTISTATATARVLPR
jgi:hypothetical protein